MTPADFIFPETILITFNLVNSRMDAYRIMKDKTIAHFINFGAYAIVTGILVWIFYPQWAVGIVFGLGAFFNRQLSFDIPLNLRRKLPWYYQSAANPPKAIMDRIERLMFGRINERWIVVIYGACYIICLIIKWFV